jgi:hypothetical protein
MGRFDGNIGRLALALQTFNQLTEVQLDHAQLNQGSKPKERRSTGLSRKCQQSVIRVGSGLSAFGALRT